MAFPAASGEASPTALRRLQRDFQKLLEEPINGIVAMPTDENILEWHYVIMGSPDTAYVGGYYHGKLVFMPDFPWKPPAICMVTPNGRFRTNIRLCLSISDYHPESWNPGWTVASILVGLHSFMNEETYAAGVNNEPELRRQYAANSITYNLANPEFIRIFPELASELRSGSVVGYHPQSVLSYNCLATATLQPDAGRPIAEARKRTAPAPAVDNDHPVIKRPVPEIIDLTDD